MILFKQVIFDCTFSIKCIYHGSDCKLYMQKTVCKSETVKCLTYIKDENLNLSRTCWFKSLNSSNYSYSWMSIFFWYCCIFFTSGRFLLFQFPVICFMFPKTEDLFQSSYYLSFFYTLNPVRCGLQIEVGTCLHYVKALCSSTWRFFIILVS